jgi:[acyl-carrier-protein] S-malonyltransferase
MGKDLWEASQGVKDLFALASDTTGMNLKRLLFEGTEEELKATDNTQVAMTLVNLAASSVMKERGVRPDGVAGFSVGEYAALCEAGVIAEESVFPIVKARGELMERASRKLDSPSGNPGMAAVIGLSYEKVAEITDSLEGIDLALYNSPTQTVIAGTSEGLDRAESVFTKQGARRFVRLRVSGPFHSPLLAEASRGLEEALAGYEFSDPKLAVYANVTGKRVRTGAEARENCVKQVISTVKWVDEERLLIEDGFESFYEVGPGTVLTGLWKKLTDDRPCVPAGKMEDIEGAASP